MPAMLIIHMGWSKTIQFRERVLQTPLIKIAGSELCPVIAFKTMCSKVKVKPEEPLFMFSSKKCLFYRDFQKKLKHVISIIALDPDKFSSHGFRRGGSTFAFRSHVPADLIQLHDDWKSDAYKKYLALTVEYKVIVAQKMKEQILKLWKWRLILWNVI